MHGTPDPPYLPKRVALLGHIIAYSATTVHTHRPTPHPHSHTKTSKHTTIHIHTQAYMQALTSLGPLPPQNYTL